MQSAGGVFLFLGLLAIVSNKIEYKHSLVPMSLHSVLGTVSFLLIVLQIVTGQQKLNQFNISNSKIRRWHGDAGLLLWDCLCLTVLLGLLSFLEFSIFSGLVLLLVILVWCSVHAQMGGLKPITMGADDEDNDTTEDDPTTADDQGAGEPLLSEEGQREKRGTTESPLEEINSNFSSQSDLNSTGGAATRV